MAGEIAAAFRTVMLFISLSWLSVMYLLVYRVPKLNDENVSRGYQIIEDSNIAEKYRIKTSITQDGEVQIFGAEDSSSMRLDLSNPNNELQFTSRRFDNKAISNIPSRKLTPDKNDGIRKFNRGATTVSGSFDCRLLDRMRTYDVLGMGYTKVVRRGVINGKSFALKYTTKRNYDIVKCKNERPVDRHFECFNLAKFKLLKEALLFSQLKHKNIIKVIIMCFNFT